MDRTDIGVVLFALAAGTCAYLWARLCWPIMGPWLLTPCPLLTTPGQLALAVYVTWRAFFAGWAVLGAMARHDLRRWAGRK